MKTLAVLPALSAACVVLCAFAFDAAHAQQPALPMNDFQLVTSRYRELQLRAAPPEAVRMSALAASLGADGRWPDIDYLDSQPSAWKAASHLERIKSLCRALVHPDSALRGDAQIEAAVMRGLDDWIAHRYKNPNWWHNDIGVPMMMRDIIILLGERLQGERRAGALQVLHQYGHIGPGGGANLIWTSELALQYGALTEDAALVALNSKAIADEIHISSGDGIQSDWSYHQHKARLQTFHYGAAFASDTARLGWQLRGTPWAIPMEKLNLVADYQLQGSQWMVRGLATVPGTIDRAVSRPGALRADARGTLRFLRDALPARARELDAFIARQDGKAPPLEGFRAFPRSDFAAFQRPSFSFFLKTISERTLPTESINRENLKGHLLHAGDHYILRDGAEYLSLPPVWDWELLPGVTSAQGAGEVVRKPFVGSVSDGASGATTMDYALGDKAGEKLSARKLWACHGDAVVCLIADLRAPNAQAPVQTALDQCLLRGAVTVAGEDGVARELGAGRHEALKALWAQHAGLGYFPIGAPLSLRLGPQSGSWASINESSSAELVPQPVFLPILEHGARPSGQSSGFAIAACATAREAAMLATKPAWQVLANDAHAQAVRFDDGTVMAVFYQAGSIVEAGKTLLQADRPCLVLRNRKQTWASDPAQKGGRLMLSASGGAPRAVELPADGVSVRVAPA